MPVVGPDRIALEYLAAVILSATKSDRGIGRIHREIWVELGKGKVLVQVHPGHCWRFRIVGAPEATIVA